MELKLSPNAVTVLEKRYLEKDARGKVVETPEALFRRVAANIAGAETLYDKKADTAKYEEEFYRMMASLEFLPNSPTLMNAGRRLQQLAACFVLPVFDSLESIFESVKQTAIIHQSGGGTGFSFNRLRPSNDMVGSTGGVASGPVSFMRVFNAATEAIKQGGARRGANMGVLRIDHPDIKDFIRAKEDPGELTNFNLSVALTSTFMEALEKDAEYTLLNPRTSKETGKEKASGVFDLIVETAWKTGEPGVLFIDRINEANPTPLLGEIEATNPCGEQPLLANEPCNLGSINVGKMLKRTDKGYDIDYKKLDKTIRLGVRFLDNVIDMSRYPGDDIGLLARGNRKVGLGIMGFADLLARLRVPYASPRSFKVAEGLMQFIKACAWETSRELADERGPFPNLKGSVFDKPGVRAPRNATTTTIAPTGTLSILADCSPGIEPFYSLSYTRRVLGGLELHKLNPLLMEVAAEDGFFSDELMDFVSKGGALKDRTDVPEEVKKIFVTAFDIEPDDHIRMQAAFQKHIDNAVSKTVNLPAGATTEDVRSAYLRAFELGCKGVTVYRSGTRAGQVLSCKDTVYC